MNKQNLGVNSDEIKRRINEELGYDSDLVLNHDDEARLDKMPEMAREAELEQRRTKREQLQERYNLLLKQR